MHLWDLKTFELVMRYTGHSQEKFLIRCDFGGPNECFVTCGSEGNQVYLRIKLGILFVFVLWVGNERFKNLYLAQKYPKAD